MPIVEITMIEGRSPEAKRRLIVKVTDAIEELDRGAARFDPRQLKRDSSAPLRGGGNDQGKNRSAAQLTGKGRTNSCKTGSMVTQLCPVRQQVGH